MKFRVCAPIFVLGITSLAAAQAINPADEKPRVFVTDSQSWEISGGGGGTSEGFGGGTRGGARPQTAEIIKTFGERCPQAIVNNKKEKADYIVLLDHEGGKGIIRRDNKVAVFNKDGDSIVSHSTASLGNAVKDACEAIVKDWPRSAARLRAPEAAPAAAPTATPASAVAEAPAVNRISVSSNPQGADIEIDGSFVGNTPSVVEVAAGEHEIAIKKAGYQTWQRKMKIMSGNINVSAELEKAQ
ncbi:MAG TPA: PEGA domain-containing protein [Terriglobales bacterium]|nr:PEGA domain-containing protein [Terriglobales bacterium]